MWPCAQPAHCSVLPVQKYTIRDLNTGQLFALCKDPSLDPESPEAASALEQVTDFTSGKQLSLEEFDIALGLRRKASHWEQSPVC